MYLSKDAIKHTLVKMVQPCLVDQVVSCGIEIDAPMSPVKYDLVSPQTDFRATAQAIVTKNVNSIQTSAL